jgi:hypothetical protein
MWQKGCAHPQTALIPNFLKRRHNLDHLFKWALWAQVCHVQNNVHYWSKLTPLILL